MLYVREHWVNETEGYRGGNSPVYESFTDDVGTLFRSARKEHGRCTGKIYIDTPDGARAIGWVFRKRSKYEDCNKTFLCETWVEVHTQEPTTEYHYAQL